MQMEPCPYSETCRYSGVWTRGRCYLISDRSKKALVGKTPGEVDEDVASQVHCALQSRLRFSYSLKIAAASPKLSPRSKQV